MTALNFLVVDKRQKLLLCNLSNTFKDERSTAHARAHAQRTGPYLHDQSCGPLLMPCACPTHRALLLTSTVCTHIYTHTYTYTTIPAAHCSCPASNPTSELHACNQFWGLFWLPKHIRWRRCRKRERTTLFARRKCKVGEFVIACHCHVQLGIAAPSSTTPTRTRIPRGFAAKCWSELSLKSSSVHYPFGG